MASVRDLKVRELTVKKLTELAKERCLKGYSKKNKSELVRLLESQENPVPVLTPQTASRVQRFKKYANYKWNSFVNWLTQHLPPKPKVIDKVFELAKNSILKLFPRKKDAFDVEETKSALGEFVKEYVT